jgi:hypothetical protein
MATAPNTLAIGQAIVSYAQALTYTDTSNVYSLVQLGEIKDATDKIAGGKAVLEVYANNDGSERRAMGGRIWDEQTWFLLSLVSLVNAQTAEQLIYKVRDQIVVPFQTHATLGNAGSVFHSQLLPKGAKFLKMYRNGQWMRCHLCEIMTRQEWVIASPGIVS